MKRDRSQRSLWFDQPVTDGDVLTVFGSQEEWLSRKAIADRLQRRKTPSLIARIENLTEAGYLQKDRIPLPNGVDMLVYRLAIPFTEVQQHG